MTETDRTFSGSIPEIYDRYLGAPGRPLRGEIEVRDPAGLAKATDAAAAAVARRFGSGPVEGKIQARVFTAMR